MKHDVIFKKQVNKLLSEPITNSTEMLKKGSWMSNIKRILFIPGERFLDCDSDTALKLRVISRALVC